MAFAVDGGIEWEKDSTNKVLTIRPANNPQSGYQKGQMKDYVDREGGPWGQFTDSGWTLVLEDGITNIGEFALWWCPGFTGVLTIPNSVVSIGKCAFFYCMGFTGSLTIPNSVREIGIEAFYGCIGLRHIIFLGEPPTFGTNSFKLMTGTNSVKCYSPGNSAEGVINAPGKSDGVNWEFHKYNPQFFKVDGEWKKCRMYTKQSGLWKLGAPYEKGEGGWK